jgi:subtilisin family serine protease
MRTVLARLALALLVLPSTPPPARAGTGDEVVVQLSPLALGAPGARLRAAGDLPAAARAHFRALGLMATRALAERLPSEPAALPEAFGFHPERIVLLRAADTALVASALAALERDPLVDWAERNVERSPALVGYGTWSRARVAAPGAAELDTLADDPYLRDGHQYALRNLGPAGPMGGVAGADIHAVAAWRTSVGSNEVKLAVADTGIDPLHPELAGLLPDGRTRLADPLNATDDPDPTVLDLYGHGTPVAGVMAARTNDGAPYAPGSGVAGVCGGDGAGNAGCRLVPIKITPGHSGEATTFDIARALMHAADVGARAVNLSFAGESPSRLERLALTYALFKGCVPVCAAGNSGFDFPTLPLFPACYAADGLAISVGASDASDQRTSFSSYPFGLDLLAPGLNVYTTFMTYPSYFGASYPGYVPASGTSFAAPHVTGAVGLLAAARPELSDTDAQHVIRESADDIGAPGVDAPTGHGRLDLERMLDAVRPAVGILHDEIAADSFTVEGEGLLSVGERGPGTLAAHVGTTWSTRLAAYGTAAIPDSFLSVTGVWLRVAGTMAARGDFRIPYFSPMAEVLRRDATSVTFRGWLYRVSEDSCDVCDDRYVPLAPSNVRFGYTVMGIVDRPPSLVVSTPAAGGTGTPGDTLDVRWVSSDPDQVTRHVVSFEPDAGAAVVLGETDGAATGGRFVLPCRSPVATAGRLVVSARDEHGHADHTDVAVPFTLRGGTCSAPLASFRAAPSPFSVSLDVFAPGAGTVRVLDAGGRLVRRLATAGGPVRWDGRDERGAAAGAGVYWVRFDGAAGTATRRVVKLGR